jgi:hypothetical protein
MKKEGWAKGKEQNDSFISRDEKNTNLLTHKMCEAFHFSMFILSKQLIDYSCLISAIKKLY